MNDITIRNLDHASVQRLRQLAWLDGRPLEELVRDLLLAAPELRLVASKLRSIEAGSEAPHLMRGVNARDPKRGDDRFPPPTD